MTSRTTLIGILGHQLDHFEGTVIQLPGIIEEDDRDALIEQIVESIHRIEYVSAMKARPLSAKRADPAEEQLFNPLLGALYLMGQGELEEAFWLIFLFTHFGQHSRGGWRCAREVYGKLGQGGHWDWDTVSRDPAAFAAWAKQHRAQLSRPGSGFGNHRKYESWSALGTVVESYVDWIGPTGQHLDLIDKASKQTRGDPKAMFDYLYRSMSTVRRFGRTGKFDYLTMLGKAGLAPIRPGSAYVSQSTGPKGGGKLLLGRPDATNRELEELFNQLANSLKVSPQVIEDAICNWQKSPNKFVAFRS